MNTFFALFSMISDVEALRKALLTKVPVAAAVPLDELRAELLKDFPSATVEIGMRQLVMQRVVAVHAGAVSLSSSSATVQSGSPRLLQKMLGISRSLSLDHYEFLCCRINGLRSMFWPSSMRAY